ncbi:hypothetical protein LZZ85_07085 [Terrimonas sp. NA20]|uniref:Immunogenic protein (Bcsp31-1) n=1 Tax=Terrimonas ginsenosidimutans TaxID=2908004 RepID=A0ABS9KNZ1_9BACT|nr:hypothetical protein [Terrimonas ginsenosidimutans]MCG2614038.1 hypothetical protein [Terrimonas ginsenosidimutans]
MKKILAVAIVVIGFSACNNEADNEHPGTDTANSIVLPKDRSTDSLAIPPQAGDTAATTADSTK